MGALVCGNLAQYFDVSREHLCGYRNLQTLLSALLVHPGVEDRLLRILGSRGVPTVRQIQEAIEKAWAGGFDPAGRKHFDGKLVGTRKWIGATEAAVFLIHLGFRAKVVDFHKPTGPMRTHPRLVEFAFDYFARDAPLRPGVSKVDRLPLYFQHQGHSRTIAGVRWDGNGHGGADMDCSLLVLDPGKRGEVTAAEATVTGEQLSRNAQYQIVEVAALEFDSEAERVAGGREIRSVRIP
ncbi:peptidase family C78-domain-containing protein [Hyaloraphidium curvatum]|nr:peptidase family C78-domain-containing protein [Hyaloraphidium curvatum]